MKILQTRSDFKYLKENLSDYAVDEDQLVNIVSVELINGVMDLKGFLLWSIKDIIEYAIYENEDEEDIEFLKNNKRAIRILNRYNISID